MTNAENRTILKLSLATFAIMSFAGIFFLLPGWLARQGQMDLRQIGWIMGIFYVSTFLRPFVGWLVELVGFRTLYRASAGLCAAGVLAFGVFQGSFPALLVSRVAMGTGFSLFAVALTAYQSLAFPRKGSGAAFALSSAAGILPLLVVTPLAEWLVKRGSGFLFLFPLPLAALLVAFLSAEFLPDLPWGSHPDRGSAPGLAESTARLLKNRGSRAVVVSITLFCMADALLLNLASLAAEKKVVVSGFFMALAVTSFLTRVLGRSALDRIPGAKWVSSSNGIVALVLMVVATPLVDSPSRLAACGVLYGFASGYGYPLHLALIGETAPPELRGHLSSLFWFFMGLCYFVMPPLVGRLASLAGLPFAFQAVAFLVFVSAFFMHYRVWRPMAENRQ